MSIHYTPGLAGLGPGMGASMHPQQAQQAQQAQLQAFQQAQLQAQLAAVPQAGLGHGTYGAHGLPSLAGPAANSFTAPVPGPGPGSNLPDLETIESYKNSFALNLEEQTKQGKEMLINQQKQQTEYLKEQADAQKRQLIAQIDEQAKRQELALQQKYQSSIVNLEQQALQQKAALERQASDLSIEYQKQKCREEAEKIQMEELKRLQAKKWLYNPEVRAPIDIRASPEIDSQRLPEKLQIGEIFTVSEEVEKGDGVKYLKLADGRGWVFDRKPGVGIMCVPYTADVGPQAPGPCGLPAGMGPPQGSMAAYAGPPSGLSPSGSSSYVPPIPPGQPNVWVHQPEFVAPLAIREIPDINGARSPHILMPGDAFLVIEERLGADGILYLRLQDGRGWVFDRKPNVGRIAMRQSQAVALGPPGVYAPPVSASSQVAAPGCALSGSYVPPAALPGPMPLAAMVPPGPGGSYVPPPQQGPTLPGPGGSYVPPVVPVVQGGSYVPPLTTTMPQYSMPAGQPTVTASVYANVIPPAPTMSIGVQPPPIVSAGLAPASMTQLSSGLAESVVPASAPTQYTLPATVDSGVVPGYPHAGAACQSPRYAGTMVTVYRNS